MAKPRSRFVPGLSFANEALEPRLTPSAGAGGALRGAAEVSVLAARKAATRTTLGVAAGTLGQPIALSVTVRASASAGAPSGIVRLLDRGRLIGTVPLVPSAGTTGRFASSSATATLAQPPGSAAYYFGRHRLTAVFVPEGGFAKSTAARSFNVARPAYQSLAGGVKVATTAAGSGPAIQVGQTASLLYTGYLAKNGAIFDDSAMHGGTPLTFKVGAGQVIPGFDAGTLGMQVGESRIILIPPAQGYGSVANGPIPANSTLIFVVTLTAIR